MGIKEKFTVFELYWDADYVSTYDEKKLASGMIKKDAVALTNKKIDEHRDDHGKTGDMHYDILIVPDKQYYPGISKKMEEELTK